jgi:hypothetical protein
MVYYESAEIDFFSWLQNTLVLLASKQLQNWIENKLQSKPITTSHVI